MLKLIAIPDFWYKNSIPPEPESLQATYCTDKEPEESGLEIGNFHYMYNNNKLINNNK